MARAKREVYSRQEVDIMLANVELNILNGVVSTLLNSGANPDPAVGEIVMALAKQANEATDKANKLSNEAGLPKERFEQFGAVLDEHFRH